MRAIPIDEHIGAAQFETVRIDKKRNPLVRVSNCCCKGLTISAGITSLTKGATVRQDNAGNILISRVLHGSVADRSKQLHAGDVIHEINGQTLRGKTIDDVADMMVSLVYRCHSLICLLLFQQQLTGIVVFKKSSTLQEHQTQKRNNVCQLAKYYSKCSYACTKR